MKDSAGYDRSIRQSLLSLGKTPLLKKGEDAELAAIYQKDPSSSAGIAAKNKLISANLRLVAYVAKHHSHRGELVDRIQNGVFGLIRAAERYDPATGNAFTTYAHFWIRQAIGKADEDTGSIVRVPKYQAENTQKIRRVYAQVRNTSSHPPTLAELSVATGIPTRALPLAIEATKFAKGRVLSTSMLVGEDRADTLESLLADPDQDISSEIENSDRAEKITDLLSVLNPQQRQVISLLYGLGCDSQSASDVGRTLGISRERVRQVRERAFQIIRTTPSLAKIARSLL